MLTRLRLFTSAARVRKFCKFEGIHMTSMVCYRGNAENWIFTSSFDSSTLTSTWRARNVVKHSLFPHIYHVIARTLGCSSIARVVGRVRLDVQSGMLHLSANKGQCFIFFF